MTSEISALLLWLLSNEFLLACLSITLLATSWFKRLLANRLCRFHSAKFITIFHLMSINWIRLIMPTRLLNHSSEEILAEDAFVCKWVHPSSLQGWHQISFLLETALQKKCIILFCSTLFKPNDFHHSAIHLKGLLRKEREEKERKKNRKKTNKEN